MIHKLKQDALEAARKQLGKDAEEDTDFTITNSGAGFTFAAIDKDGPAKKPRKVKASEVKDAPKTKTGGAGKKPPRKPPAPAVSPAPKGESKTDMLIAMMSKPGGATSAEMQAAAGWQPHSVRGLIGTLKKKGHVITSTKPDKGEPTIYQMKPAPAAATSDDVV